LAGLKQRYSRKYIVKRVIGTVIVYFAAVMLIFVIEHLMPGNIAYDFVSRLIAENPHISYQQALQEIESEYGLNLPIYDQFVIYIRNVLFTFPPNFGTSFEYLNDPAMNIVLRALPFTLLLIVLSQLIAWGVSIFIGVELAIRKNKQTDKASVPLLYFVYSIPIFWLALIMILVFSLYLHIFPAIVPISYGSPISTILYGMTLPIIVVVISTIPNHTLIIRSATIDFLKSDFVTALRAEGLKESTFRMKLIRNALLPSITQFFMQFGYLIGGIFIIESLFSLPGMGTVIITAALEYDYPVIEAGLFVTSVVMILSNLAADLLYPLLDPRVSYI
jgi:peptide/nickel transport system permease protein